MTRSSQNSGRWMPEIFSSIPTIAEMSSSSSGRTRTAVLVSGISHSGTGVSVVTRSQSKVSSFRDGPQASQVVFADPEHRSPDGHVRPIRRGGSPQSHDPARGRLRARSYAYPEHADA